MSKFLNYCPKCSKIVINEKHMRSDEATWSNIRDGYGRPIYHYICECYYPLAGHICLPDESKETIDYYKGVIDYYSDPDTYIGGQKQFDEIIEKLLIDNTAPKQLKYIKEKEMSIGQIVALNIILEETKESLNFCKFHYYIWKYDMVKTIERIKAFSTMRESFKDFFYNNVDNIVEKLENEE